MPHVIYFEIVSNSKSIFVTIHSCFNAARRFDKRVRYNDSITLQWYCFQVTQYVTQVLVAKREAEIKLDKQNFGERREINKRKQMIMEGLDPKEVETAIKNQRDRRKQSSKRRVDALQKSVAGAQSKRKKVT